MFSSFFGYVLHPVSLSSLAINTLRSIILTRAGDRGIVHVSSTEETAWFSFASFADMTDSVTGEADFDFRYKRKNFIAITAKKVDNKCVVISSQLSTFLYVPFFRRTYAMYFWTELRICHIGSTTFY